MNPLDAVKARIAQYKEQLSEHLMSGGAKDHVDYVRAVAKANAFDLVLNDIADIEKRYIED